MEGSDKPSYFRQPQLWYTGVASMAITSNTVILGTVNESEFAELFLMEIQEGLTSRSLGMLMAMAQLI